MHYDNPHIPQYSFFFTCVVLIAQEHFDVKNYDICWEICF